MGFTWKPFTLHSYEVNEQGTTKVEMLFSNLSKPFKPRMFFYPGFFSGVNGGVRQFSYQLKASTRECGHETTKWPIPGAWCVCFFCIDNTNNTLFSNLFLRSSKLHKHPESILGYVLRSRAVRRPCGIVNDCQRPCVASNGAQDVKCPDLVVMRLRCWPLAQI